MLSIILQNSVFNGIFVIKGDTKKVILKSTKRKTFWSTFLVEANLNKINGHLVSFPSNYMDSQRWLFHQ